MAEYPRVSPGTNLPLMIHTAYQQNTIKRIKAGSWCFAKPNLSAFQLSLELYMGDCKSNN